MLGAFWKSLYLYFAGRPLGPSGSEPSQRIQTSRRDRRAEQGARPRLRDLHRRGDVLVEEGAVRGFRRRRPGRPRPARRRSAKSVCGGRCGAAAPALGAAEAQRLLASRRWRTTRVLCAQARRDPSSRGSGPRARRDRWRSSAAVRREWSRSLRRERRCLPAGPRGDWLAGPRVFWSFLPQPGATTVTATRSRSAVKRRGIRHRILLRSVLDMSRSWT